MTKKWNGKIIKIANCQNDIFYELICSVQKTNSPLSLYWDNVITKKSIVNSSWFDKVLSNLSIYELIQFWTLMCSPGEFAGFLCWYFAYLRVFWKLSKISIASEFRHFGPWKCGSHRELSKPWTLFTQKCLRLREYFQSYVTFDMF